MMQKKIIEQKIRELEIQEFVETNLSSVGLSSTSLQVTPMAEKIIINTSRPGLVVGRKGQSIKKMTNMLKKKFNLSNPQIEINEVTDINLDPAIIAERITNTLERFGVNRFKGIGHKAMDDAMKGGAIGIEILISGKVPSSRSKRWRFYQGYLKKCGDIAISGVKTAYKTALLKTGSVGVQIRLMPHDLELPDSIKLKSEIEEVVEEINDEKASVGKVDAEKANAEKVHVENADNSASVPNNKESVKDKDSTGKASAGRKNKDKTERKPKSTEAKTKKRNAANSKPKKK